MYCETTSEESLEVKPVPAGRSIKLKVVKAIPRPRD